ncbi:guanitoxin biosynthesis L-enduracididine beta-hydroxylase GntD [Streptomyces sp. NPDC050211]|uniref:guanitoxin biosynthesis L-enduracididine beta-hydroxylase GntD n=1 Tax=Streptomyces sp. NPDC050211 TaxID=3154932 RepID=UPI00343AEE1E
MQTLAPPPPAGPAAATPDRIDLLPGDRHAVAALAREYVRATGSLSAERALRLATLMAHELPRPLRRVLTDFRLTGRPRAGFLITGLPVDEGALGPTPTRYRQRPDRPELHSAEAVLLLLGSLLGEPFSFHSQQDGRLILDLFPVAGHENQQLGSGSHTTLDWHTEDAFHPLRADWMMLLGLRNHDRVATTFAALDDLSLSAPIRRVLFQKRFHILPDESHTQHFNQATGAQGADDASRFARIDTMAARPEPVALLEGDLASPWLRADPPFMRAQDGDEEAAAALQQLLTAVQQQLTDLPIATGELFILDNKRAVHGRRPFTPRYDGTDRWLKRLNLTADLRRSAGRRTGAHGRAVV